MSGVRRIFEPERQVLGFTVEGQPSSPLRAQAMRDTFARSSSPVPVTVPPPLVNWQHDRRGAKTSTPRRVQYVSGNSASGLAAAETVETPRLGACVPNVRVNHVARAARVGASATYVTGVESPVATNPSLVQHAANSIYDGDVILVMSHSNTLLQALLLAHQQGLHFHVVVLDSPPELAALQILRQLQAAAVPCSYTYFHMLANVLQEVVTKVLLLGSTTLPTSDLISPLGAKMVAMAARAAGKPVVVVCHTNQTSSSNKQEQQTGSHLLQLGSPVPPKSAAQLASPVSPNSAVQPDLATHVQAVQAPIRQQPAVQLQAAQPPVVQPRLAQAPAAQPLPQHPQPGVAQATHQQGTRRQPIRDRPRFAASSWPSLTFLLSQRWATKQQQAEAAQLAQAMQPAQATQPAQAMQQAQLSTANPNTPQTLPPAPIVPAISQVLSSTGHVGLPWSPPAQHPRPDITRQSAPAAGTAILAAASTATVSAAVTAPGVPTATEPSTTATIMVTTGANAASNATSYPAVISTAAATTTFAATVAPAAINAATPAAPGTIAAAPVPATAATAVAAGTTANAATPCAVPRSPPAVASSWPPSVNPNPRSHTREKIHTPACLGLKAYDTLPAEYVTTVVTEMGAFGPSQAQAILGSTVVPGMEGWKAEWKLG